MKILVSQTMEGLAVTEGFCLDIKDFKKVCKAVLKDLEKNYGSKQLLEAVIVTEDPVVDTTIAQCLQAEIKDLSAQLAKKAFDTLQQLLISL